MAAEDTEERKSKSYETAGRVISLFSAATIAVGYLSRTHADKSSSQPLTTRHAKAPQQSI